ncbi:tetratricopeptide repeat protein [Thiococcus pfennigii]|jgi:tetratricopeptide (TPR) repeat protein|uniref:tetratricopeptide repeat protein n=1 Tax=Thiococcus pfennigii TaxID=1057 RepID=UPI001904594A|nr:tetratricopeptide repeat protein [Thiococcus pfennigii]MBK1699696.1 hypothetical protein [Thiococcus pfennigii]
MNPHFGLIPLLAVVLAGTPPGTAVAAAAAHEAPDPAGDARPQVELTGDLLYAILLAEIADQRADPWMAFAHYLEAAELASDPRLAERATRAALAAGDPGAARKALGLWLKLAPEAIAGQLLAAHVAMLLGADAQAKGHLRRVVDLLRPAGRDGFLGLAALVATIEPATARVALMRALVAEDAENAAAQYALALVAADIRDYERAVAATRRAIALDRDWDQPRILLVRLLIAQGQRSQAREVLAQFIDSTPNDHVLRMLYAQLLVEEREFSDARNVFERMLRDTPKEPDVLFAIAILSLQLEDAEAARGYFERLYATGQRRDDAALYLGQIAEAAGELDEALDWYAKVEGEAALDARVRSANVQVTRGEIAKAREGLAQLRDQRPEHARSLFLIEGELLQEAHRPELAMEVFDRALAEYPGDQDLLYARGLLGASLGQIEVLERDMRAIIAANPDQAEALNALGYTLADRTDRHQEAHALIERALALKPEDPAVLDSMGWVLFRMGRHQEALDYLRRAHERLSDGEIAAHLGEVLWATGQRTEAWRIWDEAQAEHPGHAYLEAVIERHRYSRPDTPR